MFNIKKSRTIFIWTALPILIIIAIIFVKAQPPELHSVEGYVFINEGGLQAPAGTPVFVNSTITKNIAWTETYGPPGYTGYYSVSVNGSDGEEIAVTGFNTTFYGRSKVNLLPDPSITEASIILNISRDPEANVTITNPSNNSIFYLGDTFNATALIMILGNNGVECYATIGFSDNSVLNLTEDENSTLNLGSINRGSSTSASWTVNSTKVGTSNIHVSSLCNNSSENLEGLNIFTVFSITVKRRLPELHSVEGFVFTSDGITQVPSGTSVTINATETGSLVQTQTFGPPGYTGYYSTSELEAVDNEIIVVRAENDTGYGETNTVLLPNPNVTEANVTMNETKENPPNVTSVLVDDDIIFPENQIDLIAGSTRTAVCNATVYDEDGYEDIISASAFFYNTGDGKTWDSPDDNSSHYTNTTCYLSNGTGNTKDATCTFELWYYANNGTWGCNITATDKDNINGSGIDSTNIMELIALDIPTILDYGNLKPGDTSSEKTITVTNAGNTRIDIGLDGYGEYDGDGNAMNCEGSNISLSYEKYNVSESGADYDTMMTELTDNNTIQQNFDLLERNDTGNSTKGTYWRLRAPTSINGACHGVITILAVSG